MLRIVLLALVIAVGVALWLVWRRDWQRRSIAAALAEFARNRPRLQDDFRAAANVTGKPRGLVWKACDFQDGIVLAHDRATGELVGLVGVTIAFEAVLGGEMEDVEAVGNLRAATAVLTWTGRDWSAAGRTVFNLEPREVLERYRKSLEPIAAKP